MTSTENPFDLTVTIDGDYGIDDGQITIFRQINSEEIAHWTSDEWIEDPSLVYVIAEAVRLVADDPVALLRRMGKLESVFSALLEPLTSASDDDFYFEVYSFTDFAAPTHTTLPISEGVQLIDQIYFTCNDDLPGFFLTSQEDVFYRAGDTLLVPRQVETSSASWLANPPIYGPRQLATVLDRLPRVPSPEYPQQQVVIVTKEM